MKKVLLFCYLAVMISLTLAFAFDSWQNYDDPVNQYVHTVSEIYQDTYDDLILDGWTLEDTLTLYTDTVYVLEYDNLGAISVLYVKVVSIP